MGPTIIAKVKPSSLYITWLVVVLVGYVIVAMMEDQSETIEKVEKEKKGL